MDLAKPIFRLLLASFMLVFAPLVAGAVALQVYWLAIPILVMTYTSCSAQGFTTRKLVALVMVSNASMILVLYAGSYLLANVLLGERLT